MAIDPVAAAQKVGNLVAGPALEATKEWVNYVRSCDDNVKTVQARHRDLRNLRKEVGRKVELGNMKSQEAVPEVTEWVEDVDKFIGSKKEWEELLKDEEARRMAEKCCFGVCWSPRYRHNLSRKAEEKTTAINEKIDKIRKRGQDPVTLDMKPLKLASFASSAFCQGLESRQKKLDEILEVLRDDKVNRIGIYGMGGAGKTTLIQELARRAENDKLFNAVIIAEISQFPDYKRIQDQIADRIGLTNLGQYHSIEERALNLGNRLRGIKKGKRLYDDEEQHGTTKTGKPEDEKDGDAKKNLDKVESKKNLEKVASRKNLDKVESKKNLDKVATRKNLDKVATKKNLDKSPTRKKENKIEGIDEKGPQKDKKAEGVEDEKHGAEDEKEARTKGKKSSETEKSGKLLVILDNMWKKLDLHLVGIVYELEKDLGCKIIVISRSEDVCKAMDAIDSCIFKVGDLNDDEAEHLFRERVGTIADDKDYKEISKKLLKKCSRLPLSINVLADTLKNQTLSVWERILKQLEKPVHGETLGVLGDTYSIIEMSYNYLGNKEKKMFFLLCCLFPPGSSVHIDDLLKYGIGMGLFQYVNSIVEAIEQAYKWADDLKSLSLLAEVDVKKGLIHIHDDVREAGKSFAAKGEQSFHVGAIPRWLKKESYGKYSVISMMSNNSYEYLAGRDLPKLQLLRSLGLFGSELGDDYFSGMKNLKVLDMSKSKINILPSSFEKLENLETLLLEYCSLTDISQVSKLVKLQVLSFRESNITRLPKEMKALVELKLLDLTNCAQLEEIPSGIFAQLKQLEGLYMKHSFSKWTICGSMASLLELTSLPLQVLEITIQSISQLPDCDFPVLDLSSYKIDLAMSATSQQEQLLLRDLQLGEVHARDLIKDGWKPLMNKAESLYIKEIEGLKNIAPYLGEYGWRDLKKITVSECPEMDCIISRKAVHQSVVFPKLEMLRLEKLSALEAIYHGKSPPDLFSNLQELSLSYLNQLHSSAIAVQHATKLKVLEVKNCENLKSVFFAPITMQREEQRSHDIQFPYLKKLILANLDALQGLFEVTHTTDDLKLHVFPKQAVFPVLDKIKLKRLYKIEQLWDLATGQEFAKRFPKLRSISLKYMDELKLVWSAKLCKTSFSFENLKKLKIRVCDYLDYVCPPSVAIGFHQLELLRIVSCDNIKQVILTEGTESELDGIISSKKMMISFPRLLTIDLAGLPELLYFYQGKVKVEFPALKTLKLDTILKLKTLIKVEPRKGTKVSKKKENPKEDGILFNRELQFPSLEILYAESLDNIEGLWDIKSSQFSMIYPNLQSLGLQLMDELKHVWTTELIGATRICINLKEIEIESCKSLESLFPPSAVISTGVKVEFPELQTIKVVSCNEFKYILQGNVILEFPALKMIGLKDLDELVAFAKLEKLETPKGGGEENDNGDGPPIPLFNGKIHVPFLEELEVEQLPKIEKLWGIANSDEFSQAFASLRTLMIENLSLLKHVWSDDPTEESVYFGSLEKMGIIDCDEIQSLFSSSTGTSPALPQLQHQKVISFPKLQTLHLMRLESFRCLFQGYSNMEFQALKELVVNRLPLVKTLVKLGNYDAIMEIKTEKAKEDGDDDEVEADKEEEKGDKEEEEEGSKEVEEVGVKQEDKDDKEEEEKGSKEEEEVGVKQENKDDKEEEEEGAKEEEEGDKEGEKKESDSEGDSDRKEEPESEDNGSNADAILFKGNVEFSSLEELKIKYMSHLESMCETEEGNPVACSSIFPKLKTLHLTGGDEAKLRQLPEGMLHKLSSLAIRKFNELTCLVSSSGGDALAKSLSELVNLEELIVQECELLEELFEVAEGQDVTVTLSSLKKLKLSRLPKLKGVQWYTLPNLQSLYMLDCLGGKRFLISATEVAKGLSLLSLESMVIIDCADMEIIIGDEEKDQFQNDDSELVLPKLKDVMFRRLTSLITFSSTSFTLSLPSLTTMDLYRCGLLRSFSVGPVMTPQLSSLEVDYETLKVDTDLNIVLQREFDSNNKVARHWPAKVKSKLHEEHYLMLKKWRSYGCDGCKEQGGRYSYTCKKCDFDLHPHCALIESQLIEEPEELKVGKDLPRTVKHESHAEHELKLVAGRDYGCDGCGQMGELFAYNCEECDYDLHPKCALEGIPIP